MSKAHHLLENADYELMADGCVRVTNLGTGEQGVFERGGRWVSGALKIASPHLICWVIDTADGHSALPPQAR